MDTRPCIPNYHMSDYFQPTQSHWPLSHVRSSVSGQDDSSEFDTFAMDWEGNRCNPIPYQQRTIRNLTGRTLQESFAGLKRKRSSPCSGSPPPSPSPRESEARRTPDPRYLLRKGCPSSDEDMSTDDTPEIKETKQTSTLLGSHRPKHCNITFTRDSLQRHNQKHMAETDDQGSRSVKAETVDIPSVTLIQRGKTPQSLHMISPQQKPNQVPASTKSVPTVVSQPSSRIHTHAQIGTASQQASLSQSTAVSPIKQSEAGNHAMDDEESSRPTKVKKPKPKSNQQGLHICKLCDITFTRHFDLLRHNQKHQVETEEDMARRTCTNCDKVLSRVDATKRHVDTLPESCNYLRRKQGLGPLPPMPAEYYGVCRAQYYKLAQETKKPKGRKKANPLAAA